MSFEEIVGHDQAGAFFREALTHGRLAHAYLLHGHPGSGKRTFARALARNILCREVEPGQSSCGRCRSCLKILSESHPDVSIPGDDAEGTIPNVEAIRALRDEAHLCAVEGRGRIFVVDEVDRMREEAANALLKTLEEPPRGVLLLLLAGRLSAVLGTIRSRCQVVPFRPVPRGVLQELLGRMLAIDEASASRVARLAGGSPGLARKLVSQGFLEQLPLHEAIWTQGSRPDGQGAASPSDLLDLARSATDGTPAEIRRWLGLALHVGACRLRDLLTSRDGEASCDPDRVVQLVEDLIHARVDLDRNVNPAVLLADLDILVREAHVLAS